MAELEEQHDRARRVVAGAQVQMSSLWDQGTPGRAARHHPHVPPLWQTRQHLSLTCTPRPEKSHRLGRVAPLHVLWLEWSPGLCRLHQTCQHWNALTTSLYTTPHPTAHPH